VGERHEQAPARLRAARTGPHPGRDPSLWLATAAPWLVTAAPFRGCGGGTGGRAAGARSCDASERGLRESRRVRKPAAGYPQSVWDVTSPSSSIEGFADPFSVNIGGSISFKIRSPANSYAIDIYRMGYYGGDGARLVTSPTPNIAVSQGQPACNTNTTTRLADCGSWGVSATWTVPASAVSGVYFARIYRTDGTTGANQIPFVVTDNASHSGVVFMTSDETLGGLQRLGGYNVYHGTASGSPWCCDWQNPGRGAGQLQPPLCDPRRHPVRAGLLLLRRIPDDPVPGEERLRRQLRQPDRRRAARRGHHARAAQRVHERWALEVLGRGGPGQPDRGAGCRGQSGLLHREHDVVEDAVGEQPVRRRNVPDAGYVQRKPGSPALPTGSCNAANYWVDVVFTEP
jgi:N,N-dimethylformamidase beta subunit-like, C-terminal